MTTRTLIQAEALAERLDDPRLRLFDCRFDLARPDAGRERYLDEHLPGALYADLNRDLSAAATSTSGRHPLPSPGAFAARLRAWCGRGRGRSACLRRRPSPGDPVDLVVLARSGRPHHGGATPAAGWPG